MTKTPDIRHLFVQGIAEQLALKGVESPEEMAEKLVADADRIWELVTKSDE